MKSKASKKLTKLYFAYGANMSVDNMLSRCPHATPIQSFYLQNYRLAFAHHATVIPCENSTTPGALWSITDVCEQNLDVFEGFPGYYKKTYFEQDGLEIMMYEMNPPLEGCPSDDYIECLTDGYIDWNLPLNVLDQAVKTSSEEFILYEI